MEETTRSLWPVGGARRRFSEVVDRRGLLVLPALGFLLVFFAYPAFEILRRSFTSFVPPERGGLDNYAWVLDTSVNVTVLQRSVLVAVAVTVVCLLVAYPYAYLATISGPRMRMALLGLVVVTAIMSLLVRSYAWLIVLQTDGPVSDVFSAVGLGDKTLAGTLGGVVVAMAEILVPLVILPLYATMVGIDRRLTKAARSLGAGPVTTFFRVYFPLTLPGALAGALLVFVLTLGFYITPAIVGSVQNSLASQLIVGQISRLLAWGHAGALAVFLLVITVVGLLLIARLVRRRPEQLVQSAAGVAGPPKKPAADINAAFRGGLIALNSVIALWLVAPVFVVVGLSFSGEASFAFPPHSWSTRWFEEFFTNPEWYEALARSIQVAVLTTVLATVLGTAAVFGLVRGRFPGKGLVNLVLLSPMIIPVVIIAVGIYAVFLDWRIVGTIPAYVVAHTVLALPFVVVPVYSSMRTLDPQLEAAASSLGASPVGRFVHVTCPLIMPGLLAGAFFAFITSFDETAISLFIAGPTSQTLPVQMYGALTRTTDPTVAAASSLILLMTMLALGGAVLARRRFNYGN